MKRLKSVIDLDNKKILLCDPDCSGTPLFFVKSKVWKEHNDGVISVHFSPVNNNLFVSAYRNNSVKLWNTDSNKSVWDMTKHNREVYCARFSPDGTKVASGSDFDSMIISDAHTGKVLDRFDCKYSVFCVDFTPDGNHVVCGLGDFSLQFWDIKTKECVKVFRGHGSWVYSCVVSPDGSIIISGDERGVIKVWDRVTGECKQTCKGHSNAVLHLLFFKSEKNMLSCSYDTTAILWNANDGSVIRKLGGHKNGVLSGALSSDETLVFTASWDKSVKIWNVQTGVCLQTIHFDQEAWSLSLSPDQFKIIVGFDDGSLSLLQRLPGSVTQSVSVPSVPLSSFLSVNQSTIVVTTEEKQTLIIDTITGNILNQTATNGADICLDVDGQTLVSKRVTMKQYKQRCIMAGFLLLYGANSKFSNRFKLSIWDVEEVFRDGISYPDLGMDTNEIYQKIK